VMNLSAVRVSWVKALTGSVRTAVVVFMKCFQRGLSVD
jgi:hypothetical protein